MIGKPCRQIAPQATQKLIRQLGVRRSVGVEPSLPAGLQFGTSRVAVPDLADVLGNLERPVLPAKRLARERYFLITQRRTVTALCTLLVRAPFTDHCFTADQGGSFGVRLGSHQGLLDSRRVMAIHPCDDMPPIGLKPFWRVIGEPAFYLTVDGNTVVVIK